MLSPSIVYAPGDPFMSLLRRLSLLPWMPISGTGQARYQPMWAEDAAECALHALRGGSPDGARRLELAGPEVLSYEEIVRLALTAWDRPRPLLHVPLWAVRRGLGVVERLAGTSAFATWEEAELMEVPMTTPRGTEDARRLGVTPQPMEQVLGPAPSWRGRGSAAALVEVELGERRPGDVGGHLLGDLEVPGAHRDVVERHDADQPVALDHRQAADPVADHQGGGLLQLHVVLARHDGTGRTALDRVARLAGAGQHAERRGRGR